MRTIVSVVFVALLICGSLVGTASADIVSYYFTGHVIADDGGPWPDGIEEGSPVTGQITYDTAMPISYNGSGDVPPRVTYLEDPIAESKISVSITLPSGTRTAFISSGIPPLSTYAEVIDGDGSTSLDRLEFDTSHDEVSTDEGVIVVLADDSGMALDDTALPLALGLDDFTFAAGAWWYPEDGTEYEIFFSIDSLTTDDPAAMIVDLVAKVAGLNLQSGIDNSLDAKLDAALNALDDLNAHNDVAAVNSLYAFINAVEAQRDKKLTSEQADVLVEMASGIIALIESS